MKDYYVADLDVCKCKSISNKESSSRSMYFVDWTLLMIDRKWRRRRAQSQNDYYFSFDRVS